MRYQALYRKYRPQRFSEIVGQGHVVDTLLREITEDKVAHAYLFAGPRGTGKTTTARLLAKSLNCEDRGPDGEPDNECASCLGITEGTSIDVIELDAASHNKVEDVREIRMNVGTVAAAGPHRVYILDEAHMLSRAAGNALLKTLEEPPEHVIFVLATTEPYKLLDTIRSRSQRFDFHPVAAETLIAYLEEIAAREGFDTRPEGLAMIATHARGSVRDAMSLLEQVAALGEGTVEAEGVVKALGLADRDAFTGLATAIADQDAPAALGLVARLAARGADLRRFVADALGFFRGVFLAQYAPNLEEITDEPPDVLGEWRKTAGQLSSTVVLRAIDQFSEALLHLRAGREERLVLELTLLRLTRPEIAVDQEALLSRVERLEQGVTSRESRVTSQESRVESPESRVESPEEEPEEPQPAAATPKPAGPAAEVSLGEFSAAWPAIVARIRDQFGARRHAFLKVAEPVAVENGVAVLALPTHQHFHLEQLNADTELQSALADIAAELLGGSIALEFRSGDGEERPSEPERAPDKERLTEGAGPEDPADLIVDMLGGEVVSE